MTVTAPHSVSPTRIERLLADRHTWINEATARMQNIKTLPVSGRRAYLKYREQARALITERVVHWNVRLGYAFNRIAIKDTRRAWGSCSRKGNLNFSYALLFLPQELVDYVVVHELCHLKEHNHSRAFWLLVERVFPNYRLLRAELRTYARC